MSQLKWFSRLQFHYAARPQPVRCDSTKESLKLTNAAYIATRETERTSELHCVAILMLRQFHHSTGVEAREVVRK